MANGCLRYHSRLNVSRSDIHFPQKHEALRDDVHALGALVGEILREQGGEELFQLVEHDRVAAIGRREGDEQAAAELLMRVRGRPPGCGRWLSLRKYCLRRRMRCTFSARLTA